MTLFELGRRIANLFRRGQMAAGLREEMELHIELRAQKLREKGFPDAANTAQRQFGNRTLLQETSSEIWGWPAWERFAQDLRQAFRALLKTPTFTTVAVLTLALGLGINTAVFSVVNAIMIRSLPYQEPGRLVSVWEQKGVKPDARGPAQKENVNSARRPSVAAANLMDWRRARAFVGLAGHRVDQMNLTGIGAPDRIFGQWVTANFFPVLGVEPLQGRNFLSNEDSPDANKVVIISYEFWQRRLGGDPAALNRYLTLDGEPHQLIGILPLGFQPPSQFGRADRLDFYVPAAYPQEMLANHADHEIAVLGRLKPGVSIASAQAEMDAISADLARRFPADRDMRAAMAPLEQEIVRGVKDSLIALLGAAGLIVLITCLNVANLLLVRAAGKRHETSVRFALGASRGRIVRQCLVESVLVAACGCAAGLVLGQAMMRALVALAPPDIPRMDSVAMDWQVFAAAAALAILTGIVFGVAPAWQASRVKPVESLKSSERGAAGVSQVRWRTALTIAEVALSLILLVGAGLLLKSFVRLMGMDLGFQRARVLAMSINLPAVHYPTAALRLSFFQALEERVRTLPAVQSAAFANGFPLRRSWDSGFKLDTGGDAWCQAGAQAVSPGYFQTLAMPLLSGRLLTADDRAGQPRVAVINEAFARKYLAGADPIGRRMRRGPEAPWIAVVGVVRDIRRDGVFKEIEPQVYLSAAQTDLYPVWLADFAVRSAGDPRALVKALQQQVWALDKDQPVTNMKTLDEMRDQSVARQKFQMMLLMLFAGVAVGLAVIGIYGVLSYSVTQRTSELGIRIALGADTHDILGMVLKQAGRLIAAGVATGLAGAFALTRFLETLLFGVEIHDAQIYLAAAVLLSMVSVAASLIPARRGARVDPMVALRCE